MSRLPVFRSREVETILFRAGFFLDSQKGGHRTYYNPITDRHTTLAFHPGTIPKGTFKAIINQTGMSVEKFLSFRKKKY